MPRALLASGELSVPLTWLDDEFAINTEHALSRLPLFRLPPTERCKNCPRRPVGTRPKPVKVLR